MSPTSTSLVVRSDNAITFVDVSRNIPKSVTEATGASFVFVTDKVISLVAAALYASVAVIVIVVADVVTSSLVGVPLNVLPDSDSQEGLPDTEYVSVSELSCEFAISGSVNKALTSKL